MKKFHRAIILLGLIIFSLPMVLVAGSGEIRNIQLVGPQTEQIDFEKYSQIFYVSIKSGSDDSGNGSKENPWKTITHALLKLANASADNRFAIFVAAGNYGSGTIKMKEYVDLFGGFASDTWKRDIFENKTILDGKRVRRVVVGADHSRIDGFVIARGLARSHGGGILCDDTSPIISNNFIIDNFVLEPENLNRHRIHQEGNQGGGIACLYNAVPVIRNNVIANNKTSIGNGGGIAFYGWRRVPGDPDPKIENNMISGGKRAIVENNVILDNISGVNDVTNTRSSNGGGISCAFEARPIISNNVIANNQAKGNSDAGGIYCEYFSYPEVTGNWIIGNVCDDDGGGFYVMRMSQPVIEGNIFAGNKSNNGGVGGIRLSKEGRAFITNNIIVSNLSGGGVRCIDSYMILDNNIIMNNAGGGVIYSNRYSYFIPSIIRKNIIRGNGGSAIKIAKNASKPIVIELNNVSDGNFGDRNYNRDPGFVKDGIKGTVKSTQFNSLNYTTIITLVAPVKNTSQIIGRVLRVGDRWGVIKEAHQGKIIVWGNFDISSEKDLQFEILPTYHQ